MKKRKKLEQDQLGGPMSTEHNVMRPGRTLTKRRQENEIKKVRKGNSNRRVRKELAEQKGRV